MVLQIFFQEANKKYVSPSAQMDGGRQMNDEFDALELVERVAANEAAAAREAKLQIVSFCSPQLPRLMRGNEKAFEQLLTALTRSSIGGAVENGAVMVEMLEGTDSDGQLIRVGVCDSRTEMDQDKLKQQRRSLLELEVDGTTLGSVLDELGAELEFDTRLIGRATRFFVKAALHRANVTSADDYDLSERLRQAKCFVVANDPYPNRIIQQYIRFHNMSLHGAPTASEAFDVISTHAASGEPFDVVMVVPPIEDMTAHEIARTLRRSNYVSDTKLLYIAPLDVAEDRLKAMDAGFDGTLGKPFSKVALFHALESLVGRIPRKPAVRPLILIVDDNAINQKVALFQVRRLGFEGVTVDSGKDALDAFDHGTFAAVLMDLQMPGMCGVEAVQEIRRREKNTDCRIPIVALTGASSLEEQAMTAGCDDFLLKPVSKDKLAQSLESLIPKQLLEQARQFIQY
jgi:CheY-like chemotaxis protein